jgi:hypothetical protein
VNLIEVNYKGNVQAITDFISQSATIFASLITVPKRSVSDFTKLAKSAGDLLKTMLTPPSFIHFLSSGIAMTLSDVAKSF